MKTNISRPFALIFLLLIIAAHQAKAQVPYKPKDIQLYNTIFHMDSVCFNAFNGHDTTTLKKVFSEGVEFYNDGNTLSYYEQTMKNFKKMFKMTPDLRRELVAGSLEVYPLKDFGAIEVGVHRFTHIENGKEEIGIFKFVQVWQLKDGEWKITRVISYNH